ncbi:LysE family transporter [Fibrobacter sp. UWB12]|uniref:LysE family transporter n=1 Tax=Fibrobacter sp. UWB12 TaxID=1896203 RepID=UPI0009164C72|nr:LysE family transporter [Fibrobacter sp. UWB12]SHK62524.1 cysteine/O-acetylserine efflux protein [Fibrobacter sp. UWB12]
MCNIALSFLLYAFVSGITPGPANLCSLSVAMGSGKSVAIKQWYGIFTGYTIVSLVSVFIVYFISSVFENFIKVFSFVGATYIAYLAISLIIQAFKPLKEIRNNSITGSFRTGLFVQLTNVKIMVFCLTAITTYMLPYHQDFPHLFFLGLLLPLTGPICNLAWLFAGVLLQGLFKKHHRIFYTLMGFSLLYCAIGIVK